MDQFIRLWTHLKRPIAGRENCDRTPVRGQNAEGEGEPVALPGNVLTLNSRSIFITGVCISKQLL